MEKKIKRENKNKNKNKKKLSPPLSALTVINVLNIHKISLYISISLETTNTAKFVSIHVLVNSGTTKIFIYIVYRYEF